MEIKRRILDILSDGNSLSGKEIAKKMGYLSVNPTMDSALAGLQKSCEIVRSKEGKYGIPATFGLYRGRLERNRRGFGFVRKDGGDIFVAPGDINGAMHGQTVLVSVSHMHTGKQSGRIVKVSAEPFFVTGVYQKQRVMAVVVCDNRLQGVIRISKKGKCGAEYGQKVVVEVTRLATAYAMGEGRIIEILGFQGEKGVDILSVARQFGLYAEFPGAVETQASLLCEPTEKELRGRAILFDDLIFTIDGEDAKDLDDAVSLTTLDNGNAYLGVHIADVSHYIAEDSALDREAKKRGTSVYLVDRVIPMLPKALSNGICSLNEHVVRLTLSCFMEIDRDGNVVSHKICESAIRSRHRMTYTDVNAMLAGDERMIRKYRDLHAVLKRMNALAKRLRERRFAQGAIDFDIPESKIELDREGKPKQISLRERGNAERLIEEFMILCNNTVAEAYFYRDMPFVYRVHERPDGAKMHEFSVFLRNLGFVMRGGSEPHGKALQSILDASKDQPTGDIIKRLMLRSMKKAKYAPVNCGHFGLASPAYSHFTSPIRRYPDMQIHRIIKRDLHGQWNARIAAHYEEILPGVCQQCCDRELNAIEAERCVDDMKKAEYMEQFVGQSFSGVVSGVTAHALFVELENTVEGVLPLASMLDDYYNYYEEQYCVIGQRTKKRISLGDCIEVKLDAADAQTGRVEFSSGKKSFKKRRHVV